MIGHYISQCKKNKSSKGGQFISQTFNVFIIYIYIYSRFMVNVGKYTIHWVFEYGREKKQPTHFCWVFNSCERDPNMDVTLALQVGPQESLSWSKAEQYATSQGGRLLRSLAATKVPMGCFNGMFQGFLYISKDFWFSWRIWQEDIFFPSDHWSESMEATSYW